MKYRSRGIDTAAPFLLSARRVSFTSFSHVMHNSPCALLTTLHKSAVFLVQFTHFVHFADSRIDIVNFLSYNSDGSQSTRCLRMGEGFV